MINYLFNKSLKNNKNSFYKYNNNKKNSLLNIHQKKYNLNVNQPMKNKIEKEIIEINSQKHTKKGLKFTKKIINELFNKRGVSSEENKIKINIHKTNTNSPIKKLNLNRYPSHKRINANNESIHLSLKNEAKTNNYNTNINKNKILFNNNFSNNTNITNNITTTNFTNSINNTVASITNNNSYNISHKKYTKINENNQNQILEENKINIKIFYKDIYHNIELNHLNDGLWLAKNINEYFKINLNESQIHNLAQDLTCQINNIINSIIFSPNTTNFGAVIDINKILEKNENNDKNKKYKVTVRYHNENYYFFVNNNDDDINEMVKIIISNIIHKEKYDSIALREEITKKIKRSFYKAYSRDKFNTDNNNKII